MSVSNPWDPFHRNRPRASPSAAEFALRNRRLTKILYETLTEPGGRCLTLKDRTMRTNKQIEKQANRIADAIVELVERTDGPVTLARIHREIPGFATESAIVSKLTMLLPWGIGLIWDNMTEPGMKALHEVISRRRIAIQVLTTRVPYFADGLVLQSENWSPVVLVPARAANLDTPHRLMRTSQRCREMCIAGAKKIGIHGFRLLTPQPMRFTADRFAL